MTGRLVKRNKRFYVEGEKGTVLYSPPDFLRPFIHGRQAMCELAESVVGDVLPIRSVVQFETRCRPCK